MTDTPQTVPSTPDPSVQDLVYSLLQSLLVLAGTLGVALPPILQNQQVLQSVAGVICIAGGVVWTLYSRVKAAEKAHASATASASAGKPVRVV